MHSKNFEKIERFISGWFGAIVVVCLFIIWTTHLIKPIRNSDYIDESSYPVTAADWLIANYDVKNLKFVEWEKDIEVDWDIFPATDAVNIAGLGTNYENKFAEYGVTHIILYSNSKLAMVLENDANYKKVYDQGNFKIFERLNAVEDVIEDTVED